LYGVEHLKEREYFKFPIQPNLVYDVSQSMINPFEMTAFSIGKTYMRYHSNMTQALTERKWFNSLRNHHYELKLETPFHSPKSSLGFECAGFYDALSFDPIKQATSLLRNYAGNNMEHSMQGHESNSMEYTKDDPDTRFQFISGFSLLGAFKFKLPLHTDIGHFALTLTPKLGLLGILAAQDASNIFAFNLGYSGGISIGVDYYINQWCGIFIEYTVKHNGVPLLPPPSFEAFGANIKVESLRETSYYYFTSAWTVGFKTTF
jgi:hypothetical protein